MSIEAPQPGNEYGTPRPIPEGIQPEGAPDVVNLKPGGFGRVGGQVELNPRGTVGIPEDFGVQSVQPDGTHVNIVGLVQAGRGDECIVVRSVPAGASEQGAVFGVMRVSTAPDGSGKMTATPMSADAPWLAFSLQTYGGRVRLANQRDGEIKVAGYPLEAARPDAKIPDQSLSAVGKVSKDVVDSSRQAAAEQREAQERAEVAVAAGTAALSEVVSAGPDKPAAQDSAAVGPEVPGGDAAAPSVADSPESPVVQDAVAEAVPQEAEVTNRDMVMQELRDAWNLPEGVTVEQAVHRLNATYDQLSRVQALLGSDLADASGMLGRQLQEVEDTKNPNVLDRQNVRRVIDDLEKVQAALRDLDNSQILLSASGRRQLQDGAYMLPYLTTGLTNLISRPHLIESSELESARSMLYGGSTDTVLRVASMEKNQIEQKLITLLGYDAASEKWNTPKVEQFANEQIAELASDLRQKGESLSEADITAAVNKMRLYLGQAISDKGSGLKFPSRIDYEEKDEAPRRGPYKTGQKASSFQITAEMAVDMLRGAFDVPNAVGVIKVVNGEPKLGQHRAAALMTLYGKKWIEAGRAAGHQIVS